MDAINSFSFAEIFSGAILSLIIIAVGLQKLLKGWKATEAESTVITLMHEELERMGKQNTLLATELNKLQSEIITLNSELRKLNVENQRLHTEVVALTAEVARLQTLLDTGAKNVGSTS